MSSMQVVAIVVRQHYCKLTGYCLKGHASVGSTHRQEASFERPEVTKCHVYTYNFEINCTQCLQTLAFSI
jgi:hypothetical protein